MTEADTPPSPCHKTGQCGIRRAVDGPTQVANGQPATLDYRKPADGDAEKARHIAERHVLDAGRSLAAWLEQANTEG